MKYSLILIILVIITITCSAQPNSSTTYEVGIVNPIPNKTYSFFKEIKTDTNGVAVLQENMDYFYLDSTYRQPLINFKTIGDTLFGEFMVADAVETRYIKGGLVQTDNGTNKYSGMSVTFWEAMDRLEKKPGFFMRKKEIK